MRSILNEATKHGAYSYIHIFSGQSASWNWFSALRALPNKCPFSPAQPNLKLRKIDLILMSDHLRFSLILTSVGHKTGVNHQPNLDVNHQTDVYGRRLDVRVPAGMRIPNMELFFRNINYEMRYLVKCVTFLMMPTHNFRCCLHSSIIQLSLPLKSSDIILSATGNNHF